MILLKWNNRVISTKQIIVLFTTICISLLIGCSSGSDAIKNKNMNLPGAEVYIVTNDGLKYTGELLSAKDSVMILCEKYNAQESDLMDSVYAIYIVNNYDIKLIKLNDGNYAILGIIFVGVIGAGIGATTGSKHDYGAATSCLFGGLLGATVGLVLGLNITDYEVIYKYVNPDEYDFTQLSIYSRYGSEEPDYLE